MNAHPLNPCVVCPDCGAPLKPAQTRCWLCRGVPAATPAVPGRPTAARAGLQYSLASLFLFMTLIAVVSGMFAMDPGVGIVASILAVPALARTCVTAARRKERGQPLPAGGKVAVFLLTLVMIVTVIVASGAAFFFTCLATCAVGGAAGPAGEGGLAWAAIILGSAAGLAVAILLTRLFWKLAHRRRKP